MNKFGLNIQIVNTGIRCSLRMKTAAACISFCLAVAGLISSSHAVSTRVVATVNDNAISEYQVSQRLKLLKAMGNNPPSGKKGKKFALEDLIDEVLKREEAKRLKAEFEVDQVDQIIQLSVRSLKLNQVRNKLMLIYGFRLVHHCLFLYNNIFYCLHMVITTGLRISCMLSPSIDLRFTLC